MKPSEQENNLLPRCGNEVVALCFELNEMLEIPAIALSKVPKSEKMPFSSMNYGLKFRRISKANYE